MALPARLLQRGGAAGRLPEWAAGPAGQGSAPRRAGGERGGGGGRPWGAPPPRSCLPPPPSRASPGVPRDPLGDGELRARSGRAACRAAWPPLNPRSGVGGDAVSAEIPPPEPVKESKPN